MKSTSDTNTNIFSLNYLEFAKFSYCLNAEQHSVQTFSNFPNLTYFRKSYHSQAFLFIFLHIEYLCSKYIFYRILLVNYKI